MEGMVPTGLDQRPLSALAQTIVDMKFNCVRLPYSLEMLTPSATVPYPEKSLAANPQLLGKTPLEIFDATVEALSDVGLVTILNDHVSKAGWCCSKSDGEGLWFTEAYSTEKWMESLVQLSSRYRSNPRVVGFDIRNEVRDSPLGSPTWGFGAAGTDWAHAAQVAGERIQAVNPDMLIIISGLDFSMFLCDVPQQPVHLAGSLAGHVVYTTHEYDWYFSDSGIFREVVRRSVPLYLKILLVFFVIVLTRALVVLAYSRFRSHRLGQRYMHWASGPLWLELAKLLEPLLQWRRASLGVVSIGLLCLVTLVMDKLVSRCKNYDDIATWTLVILGPTQVLSLLLCFWWIWPSLRTTLADSARGDPVAPSPDFPETFSHLENGDKSDDGEAPDVRGPMPLPTNSPPARAIGASSLSSFEVSSKQHHKHDKSRQYHLPFRWALLALMLAASLFHLISWTQYLETYEALEEQLDARWGFLLSKGSSAERVAPVWLSEFGTGENSLWWKHITRYIAEHDVGFAYWPWNGQKSLGEDELYGILEEDFITVRHDWKLKDLQSLIHR
eukprot:CAMPEP_0206546504 /NCGR_PEP_ID=MMETSP0325_2-20121206/12750_1 /ASSEMBLY_ACC=CAM_ASM_000347 /TAXON_ID=2866 /ORGANISM="Crypthecodinium cohnii, Strain Seligo" /LENGTH=556 /DNA_ID=CAMNT_0054045651 /DNA_START=318 /DNA_END=1988 /DNA_ORIENTATION=+